MYFNSFVKQLTIQISLSFKTHLRYAQSVSSVMTSFVEKQLHLLEIEHLSEVEEKNFETANLSLLMLQRKGVCIPKLVINSLETGLYHRTIATFSLRTPNKTFPFNILSPGDIVKLNHPEIESLEEEECRGIVNKISDESVSVAFDSLGFRETLDDLNKHGNSVALIKVANKVTYERLKQAMKDLEKSSGGPNEFLIDVLFGDAIPRSSQSFEISFHNECLNHSQQEAVRFALFQRELAVIHGPPGTGKTTTVIEIIAQLVKTGLKVLACAPSNVAVDNLLEKLSSLKVSTAWQKNQAKPSLRKLNLVRLGHPARILDPKLQEMSLDAQLYYGSSADVIRDVRSDIDKVQRKLQTCFEKHQKHLLRQERRTLTKELRKREKKAIKDVLLPADVVLSTNVGAYPRGPLLNLPDNHFDVVVIDECGQALEASCWIPLLRSRKCVLAGDHLQLSPTIISSEAAAEGLSLTLLERLSKLHGDKAVRMLTVQYRMHEDIMRWASQKMYDDKLTAHLSVQKHLLSDISNVESTDDTAIPLLLIDTAGCDMTEAESEESDSKANEGEVKIVCKHLLSLINAGVSPDDIAVISPYNLQVDILRNIFQKKYPRLEIKSVDGFQGREKEAVILTLVRSNREKEVGFLSDNRRLNVAVTRARRHIAVICDSDTVSSDEFIKSLLDHINYLGEVRTGFDYKFDDCSEIENLSSVINSFNLTESIAIPKPQNTKSNLCNKNNISTKKHNKKEKLSQPFTELPVITEPAFDYQELKELYIKIIKKYRRYFERESVDESRQLSDNFEDIDLSEAVDVDLALEENKILFPSSLNSHERKIIHEICDELSLQHKSSGKGKDRRISVYFQRNSSGVIADNASEMLSINEKAVGGCFSSVINDVVDYRDSQDINALALDTNNVKDIHDVIEGGEQELRNKVVLSQISDTDVLPNVSSDSADLSVCEKCGKALPKDNLTLHSLHCERIMKLKSRMESDDNGCSKNATTKSTVNRKTKQNKSKTLKKKFSLDDDDILNDAINSNKACCHRSCEAKVSTIGQVCGLCKRKFCMSHYLPEVHGCGSRVRVETRRQIIRNGIIYPGSAVPDKKLPPDKRSAIKRRFDAKLKSMEESRKGTNNSKK